MRTVSLSLSFALLAALPPSVPAAAPPAPSEAEVLGRVYPNFDPSTHETGTWGTACGTEGRITAHLVALKPWRGLGRDQWVAAFSLWVREGPATGEPAEALEYAQACGPRPGQGALLERSAAGLRVVARSRADLRAGALDLAPYRLRPGETLIGARDYWMNHGFGDTLLTLLRVDGDRLVQVAGISVELEKQAVSCRGTVSMVPRGDGPADLRVSWKVTKLDDDANEVSLGTETLLWWWSGKDYAPDSQEAARVKHCIKW